MDKRLFHFNIILIVGLMFVLGDVSFLLAQETNYEEFTLEEITVTAQKREENQQKVPIAMEVISGEKLAETGQDNVNEILRNLSNAMVNMFDDGMRVTVRGIAETNPTFHDMRVSTPTVAINVDGAYNTGSNAGQNLFDLERIEILYGPQSTMYGSNSPGGIVNIVTAAPKTDTYSASGSIEYGSFDLRIMQATFNAPIISDKVAMRLAGQRSKHGSWVTNNDNASESTNLRLKTLYQPNEKLNLILTGIWGKRSSGGRLGGQVDLFNYQDDVANPWSQEPGGGGMFGGGGIGADQITKGLSSEISWDIGIGLLSIVPSWSKSLSQDTSETETFAGDETVVHMENSILQKGVDVRVTSPAGFPFTWIVGGTYYKSDRENFSDDYYYDDNDSYTAADERNKGIYANITYPFTSQFRATAGYRLSSDKAHSVETPARKGDGTTDMDYSNPDYKIGVEYDAADNHMLFANYSTSYRVNMMGAIGSSEEEGADYWREIPAEKMKSYTIGSKSRFLGNKLQVNASAYYYDYRNKEFRGDETGMLGRGDSTIEADYQYVTDDGEILYPDFNNNGVMDTTAYGGNVEDYWLKQFGNFKSYGFDATTSWIISKRDRLDFSLSYLKTKWTYAKMTLYWWWMWKDAVGNLASGRDFSGMEDTFAPHWSGTASYQHTFILGAFGTLVPDIDIQYKSSYILSYISENQFAAWGLPLLADYQEPYYLVNGNLSFTHSSGKWTLNAYVKNATNYAVKTAWLGMGMFPSLGLNDPRTFGVIFSLKF